MIRSAGKFVECLRIQKVNAFKMLVQTCSNAEKRGLEMTEITVGHSCTAVSKKENHNLA